MNITWNIRESSCQKCKIWQIRLKWGGCVSRWMNLLKPTQTGISFSHQDLHTSAWDICWFPQFNIRNLFLNTFYSEVGLRVELTSIRLSHQDLHTGAWDICWFLQSNIGNLFPLFKSALLGSWTQTKIDKHQPFTSILAMHTGLVDLLWCWFIQCSKSFSRFYSGDLPGLSFKSIRLSKYHQIQNSKLFPLCFDFDLNLKAHLSIYIRANPLPNSTCVFVYLYFHVFVYSCICIFVYLNILAHLSNIEPS